MTLEIIRDALGWCTVINFGLLLWWFLFFTFAHDWTYRMHSRWYNLTPIRNSFPCEVRLTPNRIGSGNIAYDRGAVGSGLKP